MLRKIIKQGHSTLTITLPNTWVRERNLKAGDEIEVSERESGLFVSTERQDESRSTIIEIKNIDIPTMWKYFMAVYREGYDEVKVVFDPETMYDNPYKFYTLHKIDTKYGRKLARLTPFETITQISNRFIGFEVIEHHKEYCIIKDMVKISSKEFESSLRRVFLLILQMGEEVVQAIKNDDAKLLQHTHDIDINVDKFHDYCIRVLNKTGCRDLRKTHLTFATLYLLEMLGDEFKNISYHLIQDMNSKSLSNLLQLGEMIVEQLNAYYVLFYNFSKEHLTELSQRDMNIYFYLPHIYKKKSKKSTLSDSELEIFNHFRRISRYINSLIELRIEMEF